MIQRPPYVKEITIATSQIGYLPGSLKKITLIAPAKDVDQLPDEIPFYLQNFGNRLERNQPKHKSWNDRFFRWPYEISKGTLEEVLTNYLSSDENPVCQGILKKTSTNWGIFWRAELDFAETGLFQIETEYTFSTPFAIDSSIYGRLHYGFMQFSYAQRSGMEIPDIRPAENCDDVGFGCKWSAYSGRRRME